MIIFQIFPEHLSFFFFVNNSNLWEYFQNVTEYFGNIHFWCQIDTKSVLLKRGGGRICGNVSFNINYFSNKEVCCCCCYMPFDFNS